METALDPERLAIRQVLEADIKSYLARDRAGWERCWVQDTRFRSFMECGTLQIAASFDAFRRNVFQAMDAEPDPVDAELRLENLVIEMHGPLAWATYEEIVAQPSNPRAAPSHSHNFRLLERSEEMGWQILVHGCWSEPQRTDDAPAIEVSPEGKVLWLNRAAEEELARGGGLSISHGTLRSTRPDLNPGLHRAIAGAHGLTGFGAYNKAKVASGGGVRFPVVLGEDEAGGLLLCWVKVADGRVYILFARPGGLDGQIDMLRAIYGLSDAQTAIIKQIAAGRDLAEAAAASGVTKNTVRTHLRRVYEKVGVSSQIELLRLIVSFST